MLGTLLPEIHSDPDDRFKELLARLEDAEKNKVPIKERSEMVSECQTNSLLSFFSELEAYAKIVRSESELNPRSISRRDLTQLQHAINMRLQRLIDISDKIHLKMSETMGKPARAA